MTLILLAILIACIGSSESDSGDTAETVLPLVECRTERVCTDVVDTDWLCSSATCADVRVCATSAPEAAFTLADICGLGVSCIPVRHCYHAECLSEGETLDEIENLYSAEAGCDFLSCEIIEGIDCVDF